MLILRNHLKGIKNAWMLLLVLATSLSLAACGLDLSLDISFSQDVYEVKLDETLNVEAITLKGKDLGDVRLLYAVENEAIASYENGVVTPHQLGETKLKATYEINPKIYAEITIKVVDPTLYNITYVLNGGVNNEANPEAYNMLTLPITFAEPTRRWYTFKGWYNNAEFTGNAVVRVPKGTTGAVTLYAKWEEVPLEVYDITYVLNGGVNNEGNPATYSLKYLPIVLKTPVREGYDFLGWYETEDFSGSAVTKIVEDTTGDKTFYAKWDYTIYDITYELDGGVNAETNPTTFTLADLPVTSFAEATKEGYIFRGWYDNADFTGDAVTEITTIGYKTLYAKFDLIVDYSLSYVLNGGSCPLFTTRDEMLNAFLTDLYAYVKPTEDLTTFMHGVGLTSGYAGLYYSNATYRDMIYAKDTKDSDASKPYFINQPEYNAKWVPFFDLMDALIREVNSTQSFWGSPYVGNMRMNEYFKHTTRFTAAQYARMPVYGPDRRTYTEVSDTFTLQIPTKAGYNFMGWYDNAEFAGSPVTEIVKGSTGNKTLYAKWGQEFDITYVLDGGTNNEANPAKYNTVNLPVAIAEPTKEGYKFLGWFGNADFTGNAITLFGVGTSGAKTLYAKWAVEYNITYVLDGGTNNENNPAAYHSFILPFTLLNPSKEGFSFVGWYETADFSGTAVTEIGADATGDKTYYAKWDATLVEYTLTYVLDGGTNAAANPDHYDRNDLPLTLGNPTRAGYAFLGWFDNVNLTGTPVTGLEAGATGDRTFYGKWELDTFAINYELDGGYWRYASKTEMLEDFLTDFYHYISPADDIETFMHGAGKTTGFAGTWYSNTNYKNKLYKALTRQADASLAYFINQPEYNAKWLVFYDFLDALVTELNSTQNLWGSTYTGFIRIDNYFNGTGTWKPEQLVKLARIPDFSPAEKTFTIDSETITLGTPDKEDTAFLGWYDNPMFAGKPITVVSKGSVGDKVFYARWEEKYNINYFVNPAWNGTEAGATVTYGEYTLTFGTNAFATIQAALDAAQAGNVIMLTEGTYADAATVAKDDITIIGPYANLDPNFNTRANEAVLTNSVTIAANVKNLILNGLAFTGMGQVIGDVNGGIDHFVFKYNKVYESSGAILTGTLYFRVDAGKNTNFYLMNNLFTGASATSTSPRFFRGSELENLTITDNVFNLGTGQASDAIRFGGTGTEATGTGIGLAGVVNISGNQFLNVGQYGLFIRRYSATEVNMINNYFENIGFAAGTYDSTSAINFSNFAPVDGVKTVFTIAYNTFKHFKTGIRLEAAGQTLASWEAAVNYNKFIDKAVVAGTFVSDNDKNDVDLINAEYNYYDITPTVDLFKGVSSFANNYANEADVPVLDASGQVLVTTVTITNPVANLNEYATYQLNVTVAPEQATDKRVAFESSNTDVIKVNQFGLLEVVGLGNAVITAKSVGNAVVYTTINITINELTHIEITYEGTGVVEIGNKLQLTATVNPASAGTVTWSSSNEAVMTVDETGLVTALTAGEAIITATLATDENIKMTVGLVVADAFTEADALMAYLTSQSEGVVLYQNIDVVGYQFIYKHNLYGSVNKYFFTNHNVTEQIVPSTNSNRPGTPMDPALQYITIHDTASSAATATAKMHADYMTNNTDGTTSWHYTVDESSIYHHIPDNEHAWHAGDGSNTASWEKNGITYPGGGNMSSIGIETCVNEGSDLYATWQRTAKLVANLLVTHNLGTDDVRQHYDFSGKNCPQTMRNANLWGNFMDLVRTEYEVLTKYNDYTITFVSNNTELLDNTGRIVKVPLYSTDVTYTITVAKEGYTKSMTFHAVIPGQLSWN